MRIERQADGHDLANRRFRIVLQKRIKTAIECVPTYYVITERFLLYVLFSCTFCVYGTCPVRATEV